MSQFSLHGKSLRQSNIDHNLTSFDKNVTQPCVDASITVGAEGATAANVRRITIQLKKSDGSDIDYVENVDLITYTSSAMTAFGSTGASTGISAGTDGALLTVIAKKVFMATSEIDGGIDVLYTDTSTATTTCLGVRLPTGRVVTSSAFANA